jgi:hypothetical protein
LHRVIGHQSFQPLVFLLKAFEPPRLIHLHLSVLALPPVIRLVLDVVLPAHFLHCRPGLRLSQDPDYLLHRESTLFHFSFRFLL